MSARIRLIFAVIVIGITAGLCSAAPPNILIITADNLGYGDLPCFNAESEIHAPNFDRLASEGAQLTQFYTASPTGTVSRACLLTGRIAQRHGLVDQLAGIAGNYGQGLDPSENLISQQLSAVGYATGCFGKWNIGFAAGSRPTERGFDEFFGHVSGNIDYETHVYNGRHDMYRGVEEARVDGYATSLFADAAIEFITRHRQRPWFCYLPFNAPHFPNPRNKPEGQPATWQAPDRAFDAYTFSADTNDPRQRYMAVVTALDSALGRVLDSLDQLGEADDTFLFFFSDNGAFMLADRGLEVATNQPLRNGGVTCWEGGIRVAALARWPNRIRARSVIDEVLWSPDLSVACARMSGSEQLDDTYLDGRDPLPVLVGGDESPHRSLFFEYRKHAALRMGDWKIVRSEPEQSWQLYDLRHDPGESINLAADQPSQRQQLVDEFDRWQESFGNAASPSTEEIQ